MSSPTPASNILIILAHPRLHASRANREMIDAAATLPNVKIHDLYETYPDFHIDVAKEKEKLEVADLVVFQHPIQWYSMPALLKEWVDIVLEDGWAFGKQGTALRNKAYWLAVTTGSAADAYAATGMHHLPFSAFLPQFQQTASLCGMRWQTPLVLHDAHQLSQLEIVAHAQRYVELLSNWPHWASQEDSVSNAGVTN